MCILEKKRKKEKLKHEEDTWQEFIFSKLFMLGKAPPTKA
jgi:hypothetical protein